MKQFVIHYKDWEPVNSGILLESASVESLSSSDDVIVGCSAGHPVEVIRVLIEEVTQLISLVSDCKLPIIAIVVIIYFTFCPCKLKWFTLQGSRNKFMDATILKLGTIIYKIDARRGTHGINCFSLPFKLLFVVVTNLFSLIQNDV